jgi:hypothetical protein
VCQVLNKIDFIYTSGQSCSGSYKDHGQYVNQIKGHEVDKDLYLGFIKIRADTSDPMFSSFNDGLESLCGLQITVCTNDDGIIINKNPSVKRLRIDAYVPEEVLDPAHPKHQTYLTEIWNKFELYLIEF